MAQKIRAAEAILREKGIAIATYPGGLEITVNCGKENEFRCVMRDQAKCAILTFPSEFEPTYLHYEDGQEDT